VGSALQGVEAVHAGARFVVCDQIALTDLQATVGQIRSATSERLEIACSGPFALLDAGRVARSGVDHVYVDSLIPEARAVQVSLTVY
jgi:nicotinate-nucleotide pyrophosphorylase